MALRKNVLKPEEMDIRTFDTSQVALHRCLDRIKKTTDEDELRHLTAELQKICSAGSIGIRLRPDAHAHAIP